MTFCGITSEAFAPPDPDNPCCYGAAMGRDCTCWETRLDRRRSKQLQSGPPAVMPAMCSDCAYRRNSPERTAAGGDPPSNNADQPFYCHDGVAVAAKYVHPSGAERPGDPADYQPRIVGDRPFRADGRPMALCAGWAASTGMRPTASKSGGAL